MATHETSTSDPTQERSRAFRAAFKCYDQAAARAGMTYLDRAAKLLPSNFVIVRFTPAEIRRMKKACRLGGWTAGEEVLFVRHAVLNVTEGILPGKRRRSNGSPQKERAAS
jgi:hypothetical protein